MQLTIGDALLIVAPAVVFALVVLLGARRMERTMHVELSVTQALIIIMMAMAFGVGMLLAAIWLI